jgi:hypothetical protein
MNQMLFVFQVARDFFGRIVDKTDKDNKVEDGEFKIIFTMINF